MEEEQQQPELFSGVQEGDMSSPREMYGSAMLKLTNPENEISKMELTFKNAKLDGEGNVIESDTPLMNELGINSIIGIVQTVMNQVTIMSNISKADIENIMMFLSDTLARDLMVNRVDYGIESKAARDKIFFTALTTTYITLKRGYEEGDKRFWKGSVQEYRTTVDNVGSRSKGILSKINPWSG